MHTSVLHLHTSELWGKWHGRSGRGSLNWLLRIPTHQLRRTRIGELEIKPGHGCGSEWGFKIVSEAVKQPFAHQTLTAQLILAVNYEIQASPLTVTPVTVTQYRSFWLQ